MKYAYIQGVSKKTGAFINNYVFSEVRITDLPS